MIEIAEIDHALALAKDRAENGLNTEAREILEMLNDELAGGRLPKFWRASTVIESGWPIPWDELREEALLAVNADIVSMLERKGREDAGREKANSARDQERSERQYLVRLEYRAGDSAAKVRRRIHQNHQAVYSLRSIQRDLEEIRSTEN